MRLDARPAPHRLDTDDEMDRAIMRGSPFAMPAPPAGPPLRGSLPLGDMLRAMLALGLVCALVAALGGIIMG